MTQSTLYVHIGAPKTGSTLLQKSATARRDELASLGLLYPASAHRGGGHHDIAFLLQGGYPEWAKPQSEPLDSLLAALDVECRAFEGDVLLSSENFYLLPRPDLLHERLHSIGLLGRDRVRIVVYIRRQDHAVSSWYNQVVKAQGFEGTVDDAIRSFQPLWDYARNLALWEHHFGRGNVLVRRYDENWKSGPGLQVDFWSTVCPRALPLFTEDSDATTNISLNRDLLEFQRVINRLPISSIEKRTFHRDLMALTAAGDHPFFDNAPVLAPEQVSAVVASYSAGNRIVADRYFGGTDLFAPPPPPAEAKVEPYRGLDPEKSLAILAWLIARRTPPS